MQREIQTTLIDAAESSYRNITSAHSRVVASELFRGAAPYYARHALCYSDEFFRSLARVCNLTRDSRVLDLGAGTGQIGIPLARLVADVFCVDASDEMIREAKRTADADGIKNVGFQISRSEDITESMSSFDLATIAGSFFWMDRSVVLAKLARILRPDGCVAVINRERSSSEPGEWYQAMLNYITDFWDGSLPAGPGAVRPVLTMSDREVLLASAFEEVTELRHSYEHHWNIDDLLGFLYSRSMAAPGTLGTRRDEFEKCIRRLLLSYSPSGSFVERGHITTLVGYRPLAEIDDVHELPRI